MIVPKTVFRPFLMLMAASAAVVTVAATCAPCRADLYGAAEVVDGNTLVVRGQPVRLYGVDAPELGQTCAWSGEVVDCGALSRSAARDLVARVEHISCKTRGRDDTGRWIAVCYAENADIGLLMVHAGWALADRTQSLNYVRTEHCARNAKRGMWRGEFDPPWVWRRHNHY